MSEADATPSSAAPPRFAKLVTQAKRWLPWASLLVGLLGAFLMDRSPRSAWLIVATALLGWGAILGFAAVGRLDPERFEGRRRMLVRAARFLALMASQSLSQNGLLFALPFYVQATALSFKHALFLALLLGAAVVTLWDPLYERVVKSHAAAFALQGFSAFCALNAVLPSLGLSNAVSLVLAGLVSAAGVPLQAWVLAPVQQRKRSTLVSGVAAGLGIPLFIAFAGAPFIPPAPLRLADGGIGTNIEDRQLVDRVREVEGLPEALYCWTAVAAPRGLKDELFHVWRQDGEVVDRVPLVVSGGRELGFRTWSRKTRFGKRPYGKWACSVETAAGQLLGRRVVDIRRLEELEEPEEPEEPEEGAP